MELLGFVLFTVSTLAVQGRIMDRDGCNGKKYCTRPTNYYPQLEIDQTLQAQVPAIKMESNLIQHKDLERWSIEGNCAADAMTITPYSIIQGNSTKLIVQSDFFKQTISIVRCRSDITKKAVERSLYNNEMRHQCFKDFIVEAKGFTAECFQRKVRINLYTWSNGEILLEPFDIDADCTCIRKLN